MRKIDKESFKKKVNDNYEKFKEYEIFYEEYVDYDTEINLKHNCGFKFKRKPKQMFEGKNKCVKCVGGINKNHEDFIYSLKNENIYDLFIPLERYKGSKIKINFRHTLCNETFKSTPNNLLYYKKCPKCSKYKKKNN
ncbi:hypothetical protein CPT_Machias_169 [Staphylococcus phage Machias]|nr:hypothetical protein CPT_Machias_169 [Staphylococcus phage Machias]